MRINQTGTRRTLQRLGEGLFLVQDVDAVTDLHLRLLAETATEALQAVDHARRTAARLSPLKAPR